MNLLEVKNASKAFGNLIAVRDVSLAVKMGELRAVIGPNGAGKTTFFNLISGFLHPTSGSVDVEIFTRATSSGLDPTQLDATFVSDRDQEPFVVAYGSAIGRISGDSTQVVAHEKTGNGPIVPSRLKVIWLANSRKDLRLRGQCHQPLPGTGLDQGVPFGPFHHCAPAVHRVRDAGEAGDGRVVIAAHDADRLGAIILPADLLQQGAGGFHVTTATLTARVDDRTFRISTPLYLDYMMSNGATARRAFPIVAGWKVKLHAGVGTFVPKPQTPFQWVSVA